MKRIYDSILGEHLGSLRQMAFVAGPRQVGKTTTCRALADAYLNWDASADRRLIVAGAEAASQACGLNQLTSERPVLVFDELHKYPHWKKFLKGFFDIHEADCHIVVTGSSRLDVYRCGGDSLMGRYFLYRMHPFSVAELNTTNMPEAGLIREPMPIDDDAWEALLRFGGFPEPMLSASDRFSKRWQRLRHAQLFKEDVRDLTRIQDVALVEIMGLLLAERSGQQLTVANLAQDVGVAPNTAKAWVETLCALHVGFLVRPWFRNISSALRKEPKWFLRDWSTIEDVGQRAETIIACHLLKAVEGWTDLGFGTFDLCYLRDKRKREVDFLVVRDGEPWFLVEVKAGDTSPSPHLAHYQGQTGAPHAFQVVLNLPYVDADCFARTTPTVVPARTFLSQLL
jgi:uncharacterized protein